MHYLDEKKWREMMHDLKKEFTLEEIYEMTGLLPTLVSRASNGERMSIKPFLILCDLTGTDPHLLILSDESNSVL